MTRRPLTIGAALAALLTGCGGGPSAEQRRADRAEYVRAADAICEKANREVAADNARPKSVPDLEYSVTESRRSLRSAAVRLHDLRGDLGESSSPPIDAFDRAIDPFLTSLGPLASARDDRARRRAAARLRRRGDALYRAATAARLDRCGRGANAIAERAVFLDYRWAYIRKDDATLKRIAAVDTSGTGEAFFAGYREVSHAARDQYHATGRMTPPRKLRELHQAVRRSLNRFLTTRELVTSNTTRERATVLFARFDVLFPRYQRLERRLRRQLNR